MSEGELARALLLGKPYFGSAMAALQGPPLRHAVLDALLHTIAHTRKTGPVNVLEVGSWAGASAVTFGSALQSLRRDGKILCVDLWEPYLDLNVEKGAHYVEMAQAAESHAIFQLFQHNLATCKLKSMVTWLSGDSGKILPTLEDGSFDLIYIDGSHLYPHVLSDITNAKRLVAAGGIIAGDDLELEWNELDHAAHKLALESHRDYIEDPRAMHGYHPGVTQAIHECFEQVSKFDGVWAVTKEASGWSKVTLSQPPVKLPGHIAPYAERQARSLVQPLGETTLYNLARVEGEFVAVAKVLGPTTLMTERIGERDLGTLLLRDPYLDQLRNRIEAIETQTIKPIPELVEQGAHYNLIRLGARFAGVSTTLGALSLLVETVGERELGDLLLLDENLDRLRQRVAEVLKRKKL